MTNVFTGLVEDLGSVERLDLRTASARLSVRGSFVSGTALGDSINVNGVCLTVTAVDGDVFTADVMNETLTRTALGALRAGDPVNLERAATPATRLGGHIVQGHVDGVGPVLLREPGEAWEVVTVGLVDGLSRYVVEKGSIALDGVSLTVAAVDRDSIAVSLIPETLRRTTWGVRQVGDSINIEVDVLAKHVERLLAVRLDQS